MPIFQLAVGTATKAGPIGASLSNAAPAWEDRFDETSDAFEEGETPESAEELNKVEAATGAAPTLSRHQRSRLRKWLSTLVELGPQLGPLERIAVTQLVVSGSSALIWDGAVGPDGWFDPLAMSLVGMARDDWPDSTRPQAAAVCAIGLYRLRMALPIDERGLEANRFSEVTQKLAPLVTEVDREAVASNLELLAGTTLVPRSADDVVVEILDAIASGPDRALLRILGQVFPELEAEWVDRRWLALSGSSSNPFHTAAQALNHASAFPQIAVGVNSDDGPWAVIVRTDRRIAVVEGGRRPTTYKTYNTSKLHNPLGILTNPELAQAARLSTPPWTTPGEVDLEVLTALGIVPKPGASPLASNGVDD